MKLNKTIVIVFAFLIVAASLYRVWDGRPMGFAPQIAMAIFAGAMVKNLKWAFILPLLSMFISDAIYQVLFLKGYTEISGFYPGQITNYIMFGSLVLFGLFIRNSNTLKIGLASVAAPTAYFLMSNFAVWFGGGGYAHPKTADGLLLTYIDGLPFYRNSILATIFFSIVFFGGYYLSQRIVTLKRTELA